MDNYFASGIYVADSPFLLPFQIFGEIQRENTPLALPLEHVFYELQG